MKKALVALAVVAAALALLIGNAVAAGRGSSLRTVTVVMHDPGCHWFSVNGKFLRKLSVKGPIALANLDMAALKVVGPTGVKRDGVGRKITLSAGSYRITMVGQAPDDNTLTLLVR